MTLFTTYCTNCESGTLGPTEDFNDWWVKCNDCGAFFFDYEPMPHQLRFHKDPSKYKMYAGGYGSAKTSTCGAEMVMLALNTPNGVGLVGAHTYNQLEQTCKKQIIDMIPKEFIESYNKKDNVMTLTNGYEILFRSFDDEQKLRSLNLCHAWIEEANATDLAIFIQLQTRLRHHATKDHRIIMSTNPDLNWIRTEILMKSHKIYGASEKYARKPEEINRNITTHIAQTSQNVHLPEDYIESISIGKPEFWINRYLKGSFSYSEGAVFPNFIRNIVDIDPKEIRHNVQTKGWQVLGGADFGIVDPTILILIAIDPVEGIAYLYDEYGKNRLPVPHHAKVMKERMAHIPLGSLQGLYGDPMGKRRNINDRRSIFNHYAEYGIHFQEGDNRIDAGILKLYSYLEMGKLKILRSMIDTVNEFTNYHYKPVELDGQLSEKPVDKDNHFVDSVRYAVITLPDDPNALKSQSYGRLDFRMQDEEETLPYELRSNDTSNEYEEAWRYY